MRHTQERLRINITLAYNWFSVYEYGAGEFERQISLIGTLLRQALYNLVLRILIHYEEIKQETDIREKVDHESRGRNAEVKGCVWV